MPVEAEASWRALGGRSVYQGVGKLSSSCREAEAWSHRGCQASLPCSLAQDRLVPQLTLVRILWLLHLFSQCFHALSSGFSFIHVAEIRLLMAP